MGYYSYVRVRGAGTIHAKRPEISAEELAERERFAAEAEARGYKLAETQESDLFQKVDEYLKINKQEFGWWVHAVKGQDDYVISLGENGESGRAYEFENELRKFLSYLSFENFELNANFIVCGEEQGDVVRFVVKNNELVSIDKAELRFPDGSGLND